MTRTTIPAREYLYMLKSPAETRVIGGTRGFLASSDQYVIYHTKFPRIAISFSPLPYGICSRITVRKNTWQSTLPSVRLAIPAQAYFDANDTALMPEFDDEGRCVFDLSEFAPGQRRATYEVKPPVVEEVSENEESAYAMAQALIYQLGELYAANPTLPRLIRDRMGYVFVQVDEEA